MMSRLNILQGAVLDALNAFIQENHGRAPRLIEMPGPDWVNLRDMLRMAREAEGADMPTLDPKKVNDRENFILFGLPIVAGADDLQAPKGVAQ